MSESKGHKMAHHEEELHSHGRCLSVTAGTAGSALGFGATPVTTADGNPYRSLVSSGETDSKDSFLRR